MIGGRGRSIATLLTVCGVAHASNQESVFLGNQAAMTGGAVAAWCDDGGAAWYNPAGLAQIERTSVDLSASAFVLRRYSLPQAAETRIGGTRRTSDASFFELVSVPSALTVARKLSNDVTGALSVFVPQQEDLLVEAAFATGPEAGFEYDWSFSASRRTARYYAGPSLGWRAAHQLRLGLSLFGTYESLETTRDFRSNLDNPTSADVTRSVITVDRRVSADRFGSTLVGGFQWDVSSQLALALVMRAPVLYVTGDTRIQLETTSTRLHASEPPAVAVEVRSFEEDTARLTVIEPARFTAAVAYRLGPGVVDLEGEWQSGVATQTRTRRAVWNARLGGTLSVSDTLSLGGGLFTDHSPDPRPSTLGATRVDFYGAALGVRIQNAYDVQRGGALVPLVFSTTLALRYAVGHGEIGSLVFDPLTAPRDGVAGATIHELGVHIGSALDF
jgi:long-subunit fatty acid transport protein